MEQVQEEQVVGVDLLVAIILQLQLEKVVPLARLEQLEPMQQV